MKHYSVKMDTPVEFINIVPLNPLIAKCEIKVCWVGDQPNRNRSVITKEVAKKMANSLPGSPIVGFYDEQKQDFLEHTRELVIENGKLLMKDVTRPYGFVDLNARVWFQKFLDDGLYEREYLMTEGYLWKQYPETERILEEGNNHSMELDEETLDAFWTKDANGKRQFFIINEAIISQLCILGEDEEPCFETSTITAPTLNFSLEDDFKERFFSLIQSLQEKLSEGGKNTMTTENMVETEVIEEVAAVVETEVIEEPTTVETEEVVDQFAANDEDEKVCPNCGKPEDECECGEDDDEDKKKYSLEEIPEYIELQTSYAALKADYEALQTTYAELQETNNSLLEFKNQIDKQEKENLIKQFYMLSDEDKADVIDNIDKYSLAEIEAKLSVLCFRNKVSFAETNTDTSESVEDSDVTTYSLETSEVDNTPAWIKAALAVSRDRK